MKFRYLPKFKVQLCQFPENIRKKFCKQANYLLRDIRHPSLCAKKYNQSNDIWQARVDKDIRFYFQIKGDTYIFLNIKKHPK